MAISQVDILDRLRGLRREYIVCECRRCGTALGAVEISTTRCPYCGTTDITCFDVR